MDDLLALSKEHVKRCTCGGVGWVKLPVEPSHPLFGKALPCICKVAEMEQRYMKRLATECGISDSELSRFTFEAFKPDESVVVKGQSAELTTKAMERVRETCIRYATRPRGWLVLQGERGVGKTHLAYAIAQTVLQRGMSVYAKSVPELLDAIRAGYDSGAYQSIIESLAKVEMLVLDDLGAQSDTAWTGEKLYEIINARYRNNGLMVVTTNYALDDPACPIDPRILSRLRDGMNAGKDGLVHILRFPVGDYRPKHKTFGGG